MCARLAALSNMFPIQLVPRAPSLGRRRLELITQFRLM